LIAPTGLLVGCFTMRVMTYLVPICKGVSSPNRALLNHAELIDALLSNTTARSVVALSLSPFFRRHYSAITDAIDAAIPPYVIDTAQAQRERELTLARLIVPYLPQPQRRPFWLVVLDATSYPRQFASTLNDRGFVYQPNVIKGKPVTIGHQYESLCVLPELETAHSPRWVIPLIMRRITTEETENQVGAELLQAVLNDDQLPFHEELVVAVEDSKYSVAPHLGRVFPNDNLVVIARSRGNRVYYRVHHPNPEQPRGPGAPNTMGNASIFKMTARGGPLTRPRSVPTPANKAAPTPSS